MFVSESPRPAFPCRSRTSGPSSRVPKNGSSSLRLPDAAGRSNPGMDALISNANHSYYN